MGTDATLVAASGILLQYVQQFALDPFLRTPRFVDDFPSLVVSPVLIVIDDCTRVRVLAVYPRRSAANSLLFLERVIEEMPFPVQAIQTDRGREFFAYCFQEKLTEYASKFRPIKPASPHLNGKVERSQRTDLDEFYPTVDPKSSDLQRRLEEWQDHCNQYRPHGSLHGRTPWETWLERLALTPFQGQVEANYDDSAERIRHPEYQMDIKLAAQNKGKRLA